MNPSEAVVRFWQESFAMYHIANLRDEIAKSKPKEGWLTLEINSGGGSSMGGFAGYDWMKSQDIQIQTVGYGQVSSAALLLFLAGEFRAISSNAYFFLHEHSATPSDTGARDISAQKAVLDETQYWQEKYIKVLLERIPRVDEKNLLRAIKAGTKIEPKKALKWGLVHEILR